MCPDNDNLPGEMLSEEQAKKLNASTQAAGEQAQPPPPPARQSPYAHLPAPQGFVTEEDERLDRQVSEVVKNGWLRANPDDPDAEAAFARDMIIPRRLSQDLAQNAAAACNVQLAQDYYPMTVGDLIEAVKEKLRPVG